MDFTPNTLSYGEGLILSSLLKKIKLFFAISCICIVIRITWLRACPSPIPGDPLFFPTLLLLLVHIFLCMELQLLCGHDCNSHAMSGREHFAVLLLSSDSYSLSVPS